ncbi:MAG: hypothetical protein AB1761_16795 [Pseudomonadota bacterium]
MRSDDQIAFTRLTNDAGDLTKCYRLDDAGELTSTTRAYLSRGRAERLEVDGLDVVANVIEALDPNQALTFGVTRETQATIVTKDALHLHLGAIARSREFFAWRRGPALLMLDYDAAHVAARVETGTQLRELIYAAVPELIGAPQMWGLSASSEIYAGDVRLRGLTGLRGYVAVADGCDIERAGRALYERLWLAGHGRFVVSAAGTLLDRNLIDGAVWQPERIDFAAGARCVPPVEQRRPAPKLIGDPRVVFDSSRIAELTAEEREHVRRNRAQAREAAEPEARRAKETYIDAEAKTVAEQRGISVDFARHIVTEAINRSLLFAEYVLYPQDGEPVSVGEVLDDPTRWHGRRFADPIEPTYRADRRIAYINLRSGGRPYLYSHAHGGRRFELVRQPATLRVQAGEQARLADETIAVLRERGDLFDHGGGAMVRVAAGGRVFPVTAMGLIDIVSQSVRFERWQKTAAIWTVVDVPEKLPAIILARAGTRDLPVLNGVVTAPTMRADGSVIDQPGYDAPTGLIYVADDPSPVRVPAAPTIAQVNAALAELWQPFAQFPFDGDLSRGVMLAALLTAVVRRALPTAPAVAFDAPAAGTGKTLLAKCIAALLGDEPQVMMPPRDDDEARKTLFAALREGAGHILWDNWVRPVEGAAVNAFLTAPVFRDRVLGVSETSTLPNRAMLLLTGNNLRLVGDVCRRVLICRIDAKTEVPYLRRFAFDPLATVRDRRGPLVRAALTILRGYATHGVRAGQGCVASYEEWDERVRQAVAWIASIETPAVRVADPATALIENNAADPAKDTLAALLDAWQATFGNRAVAVGDAWRSAYDDPSEGGGVLREAIDAIADGDRGFSPKRLGMFLARHAGQIAGRLRFNGMRNARTKQRLWRVEVCG